MYLRPLQAIVRYAHNALRDLRSKPCAYTTLHGHSLWTFGPCLLAHYMCLWHIAHTWLYLMAVPLAYATWMCIRYWASLRGPQIALAYMPASLRLAQWPNGQA